MHIESPQVMFNHVESGGNLTLDSQGKLETQSGIGRFFQKIADAFRTLTESGRAAIAARNEALYSAMAEVVRKESVVNPTQAEVPAPIAEQTRRNACAMRLAVARAALQLPEEARAAARNFVIAYIHVKGMVERSSPDTIIHEVQTIMQRIQADPVLLNGLRCDYSRTHAELQPLLAEVGQNIRAHFEQEKATGIGPDGLHNAYLKDIKRGCVRSINGHAPNAADYAGEFTELFPDPKIRAFLSMVASQSGTIGALCNQIVSADRIKDAAFFPGFVEMMDKGLVVEFVNHKYDIVVEGNEARIRSEMDVSVSAQIPKKVAPLGGGHYTIEMVVDLSQDMTDKDIPDFTLVNASRTPVYVDRAD